MVIDGIPVLPIEGFDGYFVSANGMVWSQRQTGRWLIPTKTKHGYLTVGLRASNKPVRKLVHRLVAQAWVPNPKRLPQVNHKDEDKTNNRASNLEWCTAEYNSNYGTRNKRIRKPVINLDTNERFSSSTEAAKKYGICESIISEVCCRKPHRITAGGYRWAYAGGE